MTQDEAMTKWCPFARTLDWDHADRTHDHPIGASVNRSVGKYDRQGNETVEISGRHRCIASACMAWRSTGREIGEILERVPASAGSRRPDGRGWGHLSGGDSYWGEWVRCGDGPETGFCGLSGAPQ